LEQPKFPGTDSALASFNVYAKTFGLGHKLGVDLPSEQNGLIPAASNYWKEFGHKLYPCNFISNAIGQGKVLTTLVQLANTMAIIANKGWYYTPHMVDSIEGGEDDALLEAFKVKHYTDKRIPEEIFDKVQDGMQAVLDYGTGVRSKISDIVMCGKTGTVENYYKGKKQPDHSFFGAFAPRGNPRIAIAVIVENSDQGARVAAPIASLMVEKYLKDSIRGNERKAMEVEYTNRVYIPPVMRAKIAKQDSLRKIKENQLLLEQQLNKKETEDSTAAADENIDTNADDKPATPAAPVVPKKKKTNAPAALIIDEKKNKKITRISR
jgi:penicillin-binding protein 2